MNCLRTSAKIVVLHESTLLPSTDNSALPDQDWYARWLVPFQKVFLVHASTVQEYTCTVRISPRGYLRGHSAFRILDTQSYCVLYNCPRSFVPINLLLRTRIFAPSNLRNVVYLCTVVLMKVLHDLPPCRRRSGERQEGRSLNVANENLAASGTG